MCFYITFFKSLTDDAYRYHLFSFFFNLRMPIRSYDAAYAFRGSRQNFSAYLFSSTCERNRILMIRTLKQ